MKIKRSFMGVPAVAVLGLGLLLVGCGDQVASGSTSSQDAARQQFLAERGGGTPGAVSGTPGPGGSAGRGPGVFGTIAKIDGSNITVTSQASGTQTVVQLGSGATVRKQADAQAADIKVGETVAATGTKNGNTLDAQSVQIGNGGGGGFGGFGGGGGFNGTPGAGRGGRFNGTPGTGNGQRFRNGTPGPNAQGTPGVQRQFVAGTVAKVDGNTVTVNMANSTTGTFTISSSTQLQKETDIQLTDLKVGDNVVATGQQNGATFDATGLQVVTGTGFFGGRGGGGGGGAQPQQTPVP